MEKIKIFVVDDVEIIRKMLARMLSGEEDMEIVGEEGTGQGTIIMLDEVNPDVVLLEAAVAGGMGLMDVIKEIHNVCPDAKIILVTDATSLEKVIPAAAEGVVDFISKPFQKDMVLRTIREAMIEN